jgi:hypothetical protein
MNRAVEKWITGETPVLTPIAGLLLSTCGVSCPLEDEMLIWPQGGPTSTLTLSDLLRTVRGRPLASAGACGGCYSPQSQPARTRSPLTMSVPLAEVVAVLALPVAVKGPADRTGTPSFRGPATRPRTRTMNGSSSAEALRRPRPGRSGTTDLVFCERVRARPADDHDRRNTVKAMLTSIPVSRRGGSACDALDRHRVGSASGLITGLVRRTYVPDLGAARGLAQQRRSRSPSLR